MNMPRLLRFALGGIFFSTTVVSFGKPGDFAKPAAPLGLVRLKTDAKPGDAAPLNDAKFTVDLLDVAGASGASKANRHNADYLAIESGGEWSRPLRGNVRDVAFVSFQIYGSQTTIIDLAGARLGLTASPMPGSLQLMYDDTSTGALNWKSFNLHFAAGPFTGRTFAALPTLTVRLDPAEGVWDLYANARLIAANLPLIDARKNDRQFNLRAGSEGAWVIGLVLADENPIYEDANANSIDDRFEVAQRGGLLPINASSFERQFLAKRWQDVQTATPPPPFFVVRPFSDRVTSAR